ncbi:hypothetical protein [Demequina sp.]|uniref:hypothetical protein n=1 Tax=Demequina sp. TaxID=2050685 RepID=UPI003D125E18
MSKWPQTLEALMRDRGRELYGYAFALTESRDEANLLVKEALYRTFRRGKGPATIDEADSSVRDHMLALSPEERVLAVTDPSHNKSAEESIAAGIESLGSRNMQDVIGPTRRRARKHRRNVAFAWTGIAVVTIGAVWIATAVITNDPAPEPSPSGIVVPAGTMDATYLLSEASNRAPGSQYPGPPGLKCDVGDENPHLDRGTAAAVTAECITLWITADLALELTSEVSVDTTAGTVTLNWSVANESYPVLLDRAGIIGVLTTGSEGFAQDVSHTDTTLAATTTWTSASTELGLLNSSEDLAVLTADTPLEGSTTWNASDSTLVASAIAGETPFALTLQLRIGPTSDAPATELLISLGASTTYVIQDDEVEISSTTN